MRAVVFAYHDMGLVGLKALKEAGFEITAIFTHEDNPDENRWFGSVADWGRENGILVFKPETVNTPEWVERIAAMAPDSIFSFYYRNLLPEATLDIPKAGAYNLHGSLLPKYRGRVPINWVLVNGETETGVTLHHMVARADAGDIVGQRRVEITLEDTAHSLFKKLLIAAERLLHDVLPLIREGRAPKIPQDLSQGSYFGRRRPEDGLIDWQASSMQIYNLIRAVTDPYPGAFTYLPDGRKVIVWWGIPEDSDVKADIPCGAVINDGAGVRVRTGSGWLRLKDVEMAGKRLADSSIALHFKTGEQLT